VVKDYSMSNFIASYPSAFKNHIKKIELVSCTRREFPVELVENDHFTSSEQQILDLQIM